VFDFIQSNPQIKPQLYGKWIMILEREKNQKQIYNAHFVSKQTGNKLKLTPQQPPGMQLPAF
jgi:hypothetical protein